MPTQTETAAILRQISKLATVLAAIYYASVIALTANFILSSIIVAAIPRVKPQIRWGGAPAWVYVSNPMDPIYRFTVNCIYIISCCAVLAFYDLFRTGSAVLQPYSRRGKVRASYRRAILLVYVAIMGLAVTYTGIKTYLSDNHDISLLAEMQLYIPPMYAVATGMLVRVEPPDIFSKAFDHAMLVCIESSTALSAAFDFFFEKPAHCRCPKHRTTSEASLAESDWVLLRGMSLIAATSSQAVIQPRALSAQSARWSKAKAKARANAEAVVLAGFTAAALGLSIGVLAWYGYDSLFTAS
ncbi:uncharacterized protein HMPREF1541_11040 [Cyphellophora europaea CBS 101466]|uniref:Uncharacterized protein n=1 Tax=Cyphellophora europaea (strain CBS 101466) TaxID=1220924 RepID=W2S7N1_CYPE1|nr:uncharacterized protein HMPREF1541_11040 [Cyphellophora europaea CBS 101466]ETN43909.1 hypothetical protein HMPREF1541_11040 [Cyphellophora europaea CBS 101466]